MLPQPVATDIVCGVKGSGRSYVTSLQHNVCEKNIEIKIEIGFDSGN